MISSSLIQILKEHLEEYRTYNNFHCILCMILKETFVYFHCTSSSRNRSLQVKKASILFYVTYKIRHDALNCPVQNITAIAFCVKFCFIFNDKKHNSNLQGQSFSFTSLKKQLSVETVLKKHKSIQKVVKNN